MTFAKTTHPEGWESPGYATGIPVRIPFSAQIKHPTKAGHLIWRRERDSNPRGLAPNTLSKRAP
jgi:hypothetical protein